MVSLKSYGHDLRSSPMISEAAGKSHIFQISQYIKCKMQLKYGKNKLNFVKKNKLKITKISYFSFVFGTVLAKKGALKALQTPQPKCTATASTTSSILNFLSSFDTIITMGPPNDPITMPVYKCHFLAFFCNFIISSKIL